MLGSDVLAGTACVAAWAGAPFCVELGLAAEGHAAVPVALVEFVDAGALLVATPLPAARRLRASSAAPDSRALAAAAPRRRDNFIPLISRFSSSKLDDSSRRRISATSAAVRLTVDLRRS